MVTSERVREHCGKRSEPRAATLAALRFEVVAAKCNGCRDEPIAHDRNDRDAASA
jgi:hypothetical protein